MDNRFNRVSSAFQPTHPGLRSGGDALCRDHELRICLDLGLLMIDGERHVFIDPAASRVSKYVQHFSFSRRSIDFLLNAGEGCKE